MGTELGNIRHWLRSNHPKNLLMKEAFAER